MTVDNKTTIYVGIASGDYGMEYYAYFVRLTYEEAWQDAVELCGRYSGCEPCVKDKELRVEQSGVYTFYYKAGDSPTPSDIKCREIKTLEEVKKLFNDFEITYSSSVSTLTDFVETYRSYWVEHWTDSGRPAWIEFTPK